MGLITTILETRATLADPPEWLSSFFGATPTGAGVTVSEDTAMRSSAVHACVRLLANSVARLPLLTYQRRSDGGKDLAVNHPMYRFLHDQPNPEISSYHFRQAMQAHLALRGNAYAEKVEDNAGNVVELWPISPTRVTKIERVDNRLVYTLNLPGGERRWTRRKLLHIPGLGFDGISGFSPIRLARESIGLALGAEKYGANFFGSGSAPLGVLSYPGQLKDPARATLKQSWEDAHKGLDKAHRVAVLEEGLKWEQIGISPEDAQYLETRKFEVNDIARIFLVQPHMIGDHEKGATFASVEQQAIDFVVHTLIPWLIGWEQAIKGQLFKAEDRARYFAEFLVDGLMRGDTVSRYTAYGQGINAGWLSLNEVRIKENLNPKPELDVHLVALNMYPIARGGRAPSPAELAPARQRALERLEFRNAGVARRRLAQSFERVFEDVADRTVRAEAREVQALARKHLDVRSAESFDADLEDLYGVDGELRALIARNYAGLVATYAGPVAAEAAGEIAIDVAALELEGFLLEMGAAMTARHVESSVGQLRSVAFGTIEDPLGALTTRLDEWLETRPTKIAKRETVQVGNAITRKVYQDGGIERLKWVAYGEDCPFCTGLDGTIVSITQSFAQEGETLEAEGREPITFKTNIGHPPIHLGCDCSIVPA